MNIKGYRYFKNQIRLAVLAFGMCTSVSIIFSTQPLIQIIPLVQCVGAFFYLIAIKGMFYQYVNLIGKKLTLKEHVSRMETCRTYGIKDDFKDNITTKQKCKNILTFVFKKKRYQSTIPKSF